ncbi:MAG: DUF5723 family protein [Bacteroidia bacterium]
MKKTATLVLFTIILCAGHFQAQDFMGYSMGNYSGITGGYLNPASTADSRFKFDMEIIGLDLNFGNNYLGFNKADIKHSLTAKPQDNNNNNNGGNGNNNKNNNSGGSVGITERINGDTKSIFLGASLHLPSFMIRLNPKNSVGFMCRTRFYFNVDGLESNLAHQVYKGLTDTIQYNQELHNKNLNIGMNAWAEYGITFAHVFYNKDKHFLKGGLTLKYIQGLGAVYAHMSDLNYKVSNKDTIALFNTTVNYGHSSNITWDPNNPNNSLKFTPGNFPGFGADLGVVYEYRPDFAKYKYDMDGETNLDMRWKNKYKFRFGMSLLDLGGVRYIKGDLSRDFTADINIWNLKNAKMGSLHQIDSTFTSMFRSNKGDKTFYVHLPTTLNFQADYNIYKDFYAGLMGDYAFKFKNSDAVVHEISRIALVPRWDHKWFGVYVPLSYDGFRNFNYGLNIRLGHLIVGTNTLNSFMGSGNLYGGEFHFLLKLPIPYRRVKDRDHDKVSDKKDKCPDVPGTWEFMGCPDRDGDHVPDSEDQCPDVPGKIELHGCPDRDNDGIADKDDECPDQAGPKELKGCPDRDGDGIPDKDDECPDQAGPKELKGCPDRDGDGVPDKIDLCPDKPGPADNDGCPVVNLLVMDKDKNVIQKVKRNKDGTFSFETLPADENVLFSIEGEDTDELKEINIVVGGVSKKLVRGADRYFRFEQLKADEHKLKELEEKDVPIKLTKEEAQILKKAFSNLEFETGKDVIKAESFPSLDELATLMKKKPEWKLKLSGHTDNQGKKQDNMKLSENRARAVAKHLMTKGVDEKRFKILWFGPDKPIAPNTTPQGRQKNRRVEMVIID